VIKWDVEVLENEEVIRYYIERMTEHNNSEPKTNNH